MQERCTSWPAALDLVRQPTGPMSATWVVILSHCCTAVCWLCVWGETSVQHCTLSQVCAAWQPAGRWGSPILHHLANTWDTSHVPHHCPMRRSSEPLQNQKGPRCCPWRFFCLCASPHLFRPLLLPLMAPPQNKDVVWGEPHSERWIVKDDARNMLVEVITVFVLPGVSTCVDPSHHMDKSNSCFLHSTFLQHDSWGEDRRRQQIGLCRKCKTCISYFLILSMVVFPPQHIWRSLPISGRLWSHCRRAGDPFQWLWPRQPRYHPMWQVLRPSQGVGWTWPVHTALCINITHCFIECSH